MEELQGVTKSHNLCFLYNLILSLLIELILKQQLNHITIIMMYMEEVEELRVEKLMEE